VVGIAGDLLCAGLGAAIVFRQFDLMSALVWLIAVPMLAIGSVTWRRLGER
jgi:hypothetical protein